MFSSHCDQFISLLCPILTHCDPRKSSIFPIFVIFVIYRPRFCPFVHFVIVLYCIYAFWVVITRRIKLRSTISTVGHLPLWSHVSLIANFFSHLLDFCFRWGEGDERKGQGGLMDYGPRPRSIFALGLGNIAALLLLERGNVV